MNTVRGKPIKISLRAFTTGKPILQGGAWLVNRFSFNDARGRRGTGESGSKPGAGIRATQVLPVAARPFADGFGE